MPLRLWHTDQTGANWRELDFAQFAVALVRLEVSYNHPARLRFRLHAPQHAEPIPDRAFVSLVDPAYNPSPAHPIFEGHVAEIVPRSANELDYVCLDPTHRARREVAILSGPHGDPRSIPRLVYNAKIDNDDDRAFEFRHDASVGQIVRDVLSFAYNELVSLCQAAPPPIVGGPAYVDADLDAFDFKPQEKVVFESELLGSGLERLLRWHPAHRIVFHPGLHPLGRKWRFIDPTASPATTLTLNDFSDGAKHVLSLSLARSLEGRFTAVRIFGPQRTRVETVYQRDDAETSSLEGGLTPLWSLQQELNFRQLGPFGRRDAVGDAGRRWRIADPAKRRLARILPYEVLISSSEFNVAGTNLLYKRTRRPTFQVTFDDGRTWWTVNGVSLDLVHGVVTVPYAVHQAADLSQSGSSASDEGSLDPDLIGAYRLPDNARFTFAYFAEPVSARYPPSGFEGTAFDVAGVAVERRLYDEMLAVGYETGVVATTAQRIEQYQRLAQRLLQTTKDVVYTGGCVLEGIDYDFLRLDRRVHFAAVDGQGRPIETGWESIGAIVTDVEYDFHERTTALTFSSDQMGFTHQDPAKLKELLRIRAQEIVSLMSTRVWMDLSRRLNWAVDVNQFIVEHGPNGLRIPVGPFEPV
jgi:hypothetical protein